MPDFILPPLDEIEIRNMPTNPPPHPDYYGIPSHNGIDHHLDMTKFENDMLALPDPLKEMVDPLKEIASTVKKLTFGQMVQYVKEIKSISDVLTEQAMWDWACKKVGGGFDVKAEQENGQANSD